MMVVMVVRGRLKSNIIIKIILGDGPIDSKGDSNGRRPTSKSLNPLPTRPRKAYRGGLDSFFSSAVRPLLLLLPSPHHVCSPFEPFPVSVIASLCCRFLKLFS